jgi:hypothetical protein
LILGDKEFDDGLQDFEGGYMLTKHQILVLESALYLMIVLLYNTEAEVHEYHFLKQRMILSAL